MEAATDSKQKPSSPVIKLAQLQEAMEHGLISEAEFLEARQLVDPEHVKALAMAEPIDEAVAITIADSPALTKAEARERADALSSETETVFSGLLHVSKALLPFIIAAVVCCIVSASDPKYRDKRNTCKSDGHCDFWRECSWEDGEPDGYCAPKSAFFKLIVYPALVLVVLLCMIFVLRERFLMRSLGAEAASSRGLLNWHRRWRLDKLLVEKSGNLDEQAVSAILGLGGHPNAFLKASKYETAVIAIGYILWLVWGLAFYDLLVSLFTGWYGPKLGLGCFVALFSLMCSIIGVWMGNPDGNMPHLYTLVWGSTYSRKFQTALSRARAAKAIVPTDDSSDQDQQEEVSLTGWSGYNSRLNGVYSKVPSHKNPTASGRPVYKHMHATGVGAGHDWCRMWHHNGAWRIGHVSWLNGDRNTCVAYCRGDRLDGEWMDHNGRSAGHDFSADTSRNFSPQPNVRLGRSFGECPADGPTEAELEQSKHARLSDSSSPMFSKKRQHDLSAAERRADCERQLGEAGGVEAFAGHGTERIGFGYGVVQCIHLIFWTGAMICCIIAAGRHPDAGGVLKGDGGDLCSNMDMPRLEERPFCARYPELCAETVSQPARGPSGPSAPGKSPPPGESACLEGVCFTFHDTTDTSWDQAKALCAAQGGGSQLAKVTSEAQSKLIESISPGGKPFIGLRLHTESGEWRWADGTTLGWSNWESGEPNDYNHGDRGKELCSALAWHTGSGRWMDILCSPNEWVRGYVCSAPQTAAPTAAPTPAPTAPPTAVPTFEPTAADSTAAPPFAPTDAPSFAPTAAPTVQLVPTFSLEQVVGTSGCGVLRQCRLQFSHTAVDSEEHLRLGYCVPAPSFYLTLVLPALVLLVLVYLTLARRERTLLAAMPSAAARARRQLAWEDRWRMDKMLQDVDSMGNGLRDEDKAWLRQAGGFHSANPDREQKLMGTREDAIGSVKFYGVLLWLVWGFPFYAFCALLFTGWYGSDLVPGGVFTVLFALWCSLTGVYIGNPDPNQPRLWKLL